MEEITDWRGSNDCGYLPRVHHTLKHSVEVEFIDSTENVDSIGVCMIFACKSQVFGWITIWCDNPQAAPLKQV